MIEDLQNKISLFFQRPNDFYKDQRVHSTLYLLRRDVSLCFGYDPNNNQKIKFEALFPATMAVLAGIDLVAKFYFGDRSNSVGKRFNSYVTKYIDKESKEEIYQLRNAMLHSFGLYSKAGNGHEYHFILTRGQGELILEIDPQIYSIDIEILWRKFEDSIKLYHEELIATESLQKVFAEMFPKYGMVGVK